MKIIENVNYRHIVFFCPHILQISRVFIPADIISMGQIPRNGLTLGPDHGSGGQIIT